MRQQILALAVLCVTGGFQLLTTTNRNVAREALAEYDTALKRLPDDPALRYNRALALSELGRLEEAVGELMRAIESQDLSVKSRAHYALGNLLAKQQKWQEAADAYKRALMADPKYFDAKWNLEIALRKLKEEKKKEEQKKEDQKKDNQQKQDEQKKEEESKKEKKEESKDQRDGGMDEKRGSSQQDAAPTGRGQDGGMQPKAEKAEDAGPHAEPEPQNTKDREQGAAPEAEQPKEPQEGAMRHSMDAVLDALEKSEKNLPLERLRLRSRRKPEKDW